MLGDVTYLSYRNDLWGMVHQLMSPLKGLAKQSLEGNKTWDNIHLELNIQRNIRSEKDNHERNLDKGGSSEIKYIVNVVSSFTETEKTLKI